LFTLAHYWLNWVKAMSERPILFKGEMVRAILDGRKTQTRRNIKYTTEHRGPINPAYLEAHKDHPGWAHICPYGKPGDMLWVRETWGHTGTGVWKVGQVYYAQDGGIIYRADHPNAAGSWFSPLHMPRFASRITLRITDIRVERLQNIEGQHPSESDAIAEGVRAIHHGDGEYYYSAFRDEPHPENWCDPADAFKELWNKINGPGAWDANPWVWVISFERVKP
jgi:hypothetical protein